MSPYRSTKLRKGVISLFNLVGVSEGEILEGFCSQGVIEVNKMKTRKDGKEVFTKHSPCVPHDYDVWTHQGWILERWGPSIYACNRYGHSTTSCGILSCAKCCHTGHDTQAYSNPVKWVNCYEELPAYLCSCPKWRYKKQILQIKVLQNITYSNEKDDSFSSVQDFLHGHQKEDPDLWCANTISPVNPVHQEPASNSTAS